VKLFREWAAEVSSWMARHVPEAPGPKPPRHPYGADPKKGEDRLTIRSCCSSSVCAEFDSYRLIVNMSPKKAAGEPKKRGRPFAVKDEMPDTDSRVPITGLNAEIFMQHRANVETVIHHKVFSDILAMEPISISSVKGEASGFQAVFMETVGLTAMSKAKHFKCAINLALKTTLRQAPANA